MKRWPIVLLIIIAVILLLSPAIVGRIAERNLDENLSWARDENADLDIEAESFERGWFTSEGRHRLTIRDGSIAQVIAGSSTDLPGGPPVLIIDTRIDHGIVPVTSLSRERGTLQPGIASAVSTLKLDPGDGQLLDLPGKIYSFVSLTGETAMRFLAEPGESLTHSANVRWQGADITVTTSPSKRRFTIDGTIQPTMLDSFGVETDIGTITIEADQDQSEFRLGVGTFALTVDSFLLTSSGVPNSGFGALSLSVDNALDDDRIDGKVSLTIDEIVTPDIGTMDFDMNATFTDIDAEAFANIAEAARVAQESRAPAATDDFAFVVNDDLQAIASRGLELDIENLDVTLPEGDWRTSINIEIPPDDGPFSWPGVALRTNGVADISVSASLYDYMMQVDPQAGSLIAMGFVVREGDRYVMRAEIDGGALTINGAPLPLEQLLQ